MAAAAVLFVPAGALAASRDKGGTPASGSGKGKDGNGASTQGARAGGTQKVQGVVQLVTPSVVVVRQLDGTSVSVPFDRRTRFVVDGKPGKSGDVEAGDVLSASWQGGKTPSTVRVDRG